jgi:hypothetical protein
MAVKGFPGSGSGSKSGSGYLHPKVGGSPKTSRSSVNRTYGSGGLTTGLPPKAPNPFRQARLVTNRAIGSSRKKGIY